jgi:hypothetical protein
MQELPPANLPEIAVEWRIDARARYEVYDPTAFGRGPQDGSGYGLWRIMPQLTATTPDGTVAAVQLIGADQLGRTGGARPNDRNDADLAQAYLDLPVGTGSNARVRIGRQEIALGSGRLLAANDGANVRRRFDGVVFETEVGDTTWLALAAAQVEVRPGAFDDRTDTDRPLLGLGWVEQRSGGSLAAYLAYTERNDPAFGAPARPQSRLSIGGRWSFRTARLDGDVETIVQTGSSGSDEIRAWAMAGELGWRPREGRIRVWTRFSFASGDGRPQDGRVEGFDPLFPNPSYVGSAPILGPTNLLAVNPGVTISDGPWSLSVDAAVFERHRIGDGVYVFSGARSAPATGSRRVGALWSLTGRWALRPGVTVQATASHLDAADGFRPAGTDTGFVALNLITSLEGVWPR